MPSRRQGSQNAGPTCLDRWILRDLCQFTAISTSNCREHLITFWPIQPLFCKNSVFQNLFLFESMLNIKHQAKPLHALPQNAEVWTTNSKFKHTNQQGHAFLSHPYTYITNTTRIGAHNGLLRKIIWKKKQQQQQQRLIIITAYYKKPLTSTIDNKLL